jgi:hypothetical protein
MELPHSDPNSSVNRKNIAATCGKCHYGIEKQLENSVHSLNITKTNKKLPVCNDCHSAHQITRTDATGFRLEIMTICGNCHKQYAASYFETYHGQVSRLGYSKTAKCWDCHGSHDILPVENPKSHLSFQNKVQTCKKCHEGATRQFAGYFTHATHHEPVKYPIMFWTFWSMTGLLVGTFFIAGIHTLLWLPRSLQYRKELKKILSENSDSEEKKDDQISDEKIE